MRWNKFWKTRFFEFEWKTSCVCSNCKKRAERKGLAACCIKPFGHSYSMTRECVPLNNDLIIRENKGCFGSQEERGLAERNLFPKQFAQRFGVKSVQNICPKVVYQRKQRVSFNGISMPRKIIAEDHREKFSIIYRWLQIRHREQAVLFQSWDGVEV